MIKFLYGNLFEHKADIRVNTVNCIGAAGAGIARQFRDRYPSMNAEYIRLCRRRAVRPGVPYIWEDSDFFDGADEKVTIVNFPTKDHWRNPSRYEYIEKGIRWLEKYLRNRPNSTITIPALGCGLGGLNWERVKAMIVEILSESPAEILVFEPRQPKHSHSSND